MEANKDQCANHDLVYDELKLLKLAIFGDPLNRKEIPGVVTELELLDQELKTTNKILNSMHSDFRIFIGGVFTALVSIVTYILFR